jgi:hypothetical protein
MRLDDKTARRLLEDQRGVLSRAQALSLGVSKNALQYRIEPGGPWQRLLPGVYLTLGGRPTPEQLEMAALLYAGPASAITGPRAVRSYLLPAPNTRVIDVLVPANRDRSDCGFVALHRTRRPPQRVALSGAISYVMPARAVADTVRGMDRLSDVRALVATAIQRHQCTIADLKAELAEGPMRDSARLRRVLAEVADGIRSAPEGDLRDLIVKSGLPMPMFNPSLFLDGKFLAKPDAWWPQSSVAAEVDSRQWHEPAGRWEATMARDALLGAAGIVALHFSPRQLRMEPKRVVQRIAGALRNGREIPGLVARPAA